MMMTMTEKNKSLLEMQSGAFPPDIKKYISAFEKEHPTHPVFKTGVALQSFELRDCLITGSNGSIVAISSIKKQ